MTWLYKWESPNPKRRSSEFQYKSYAEAKQSLLYNVLEDRRDRMLKRKNNWCSQPDEKQLQCIWRSLHRDGWKIRRKLAKNVQDVT